MEMELLAIPHIGVSSQKVSSDVGLETLWASGKRDLGSVAGPTDFSIFLVAIF
jgi:hypothetical protein